MFECACVYWKYAAGECSRRGSTAPRQAMAGVVPVGKRSRAVSPPARGQDGREADTPGRRDSPRLGPQGQRVPKPCPGPEPSPTTHREDWYPEQAWAPKARPPYVPSMAHHPPPLPLDTPGPKATATHPTPMQVQLTPPKRLFTIEIIVYIFCVILPNIVQSYCVEKKKKKGSQFTC